MGSLELSDRKISSVVPARPAGDVDHELTNVDLAMKLHYIQGVYFFVSEAVKGLTIQDLKEPMFHCLCPYFVVSGRVRRSETGTPFIKCNDSGVRIIESECNQTIDQVLAMKAHSFQDPLVYAQVIGPDIALSPLVTVQFTRFKCGGMSVGLNWAHVTGDAVSASAFINTWGQILNGHNPPERLSIPKPRKSKSPPPVHEKSSPIKKVDPVGDCWLFPNSCKMQTSYFQVTAKQLEHMTADVRAMDKAAKISHFEVLSAIIWKYLSQIREDKGTRTVTVCTTNSPTRENEYPINGMVLSVVEAEFSVAEAEIWELAVLIAEKRGDDSMITEEMVETDGGQADYITYGANLTFVNLEEAKIYGLEIKGHKPVFANYTISGVGDEGVLLVLPGPTSGEGEEGGRDGLTVTMVLPENDLLLLRDKLERDWSITYTEED